MNPYTSIYFKIPDELGDLNHAAAKHKMAVRPSNRRTPSRMSVPISNNGNDSKSKDEVIDEVEVIPEEVISETSQE